MDHTTPAPQSVRLIACPRLSFVKDRIDRYVPEGETVAERLRAIGWQPESMHARVFIDGEFIEQARWEYAVPRAGQVMTARAIPMGGEGGEKSALRIVALLGIVALSIFTAGGGLSAFLPQALAMGLASGTTAAHVFGGGILLAGSLAVNGPIPRPLPRRNRSHQLHDRTAE